MVIQDNVLQTEVIATEPDAATEIEFIDGSKLRVGPGAHVVLDKFVYDPDPSKGALVLRVSEGVFRFTTGRMAHEDYAIQTPGGVLGVRGTDFDFAVVGGKTIVHVYSGSVISEPGFQLTRLCSFSVNFNLLEGTNCSASDQAIIAQLANEMNAILINPTGGGPTPTNLPNQQQNQQQTGPTVIPAEAPLQ